MNTRKLLIVMTLVMAAVLLLSLNVSAAEAAEYLPGDLDYNGIINTTDVVYLRRYIAGGYGIDLTPPSQACEHVEVIDPAVAPTCTVTGLTEGKHCAKCGTVLLKQETVPVAAHTYANGICTVCGMADPDAPAQGEQLPKEGLIVFYEDFNWYANNDNTEEVLKTLNWTRLTKGEHRVYNETDAEFAIVDGRLYYDNWDAEALPEGDIRVRGKDGYYQIDMLNDEYMKPIVLGKYTLQYDLEYVDSRIISNYATLITECSSDGQCYNSFHFRIGGYGNNQCHLYGSWKTFDAFDPATDMYAASTAKNAAEAATKGTPIAFKLLGKYYSTADVHMFKDITVTIRQQWDPEMGHTVMMKTPSMKDFVIVSKPSLKADGPNHIGWDGSAVRFKFGAAIDGYIDNICIWTGWGEQPAGTNITYKPGQ